MKLNGWQRLWVIATVAWFVAVLVEAISTMPTAAKYRATWLAFARAEAPSMVVKPSAFSACLERAAASQPAKKYDALFSCEEPSPTPQDRARYAEVIATGEAEISNDLLTNQAKHAGGMLLAWIVPSLLLYGLGLLVRWVARGFGKH